MTLRLAALALAALLAPLAPGGAALAQTAAPRQAPPADEANPVAPPPAAARQKARRGPPNRLAVRLHAVTVINERASPLETFGITSLAGVDLGGLKAPLAPGKRAKLTVRAGCEVTAAASFADGFEASDAVLDLCKDKVVRFRG